MNKVISFDFVNKVPIQKLSTVDVLAPYCELENILKALESQDPAALYTLTQDKREQFEMLNYVCDKIAEECTRLGFDKAQE